MKFPRVPYPWLLFGSIGAFAIGSALNLIVMAANHGQMPVLAPGGYCGLMDPADLGHVCMNADTHLKVIADWLVMDGGHTVASPGDLFLLFGDITLWPALTAWAALVIKDYNPF